MPDDPTRPPRFPYVAALLCAACVGAAAWTWMMYSYAWPTSVGDVDTVTSLDMALRLEDRYASMSGRVEAFFGPTEGYLCSEQEPARHTVRMGSRETPLPSDTRVHSFKGRLSFHESNGGLAYHGYLLVGGGRLTGASVAGLVVGTMGVFVFAVALRHWLGERTRFREGTEGA